MKYLAGVVIIHQVTLDQFGLSDSTVTKQDNFQVGIRQIICNVIDFFIHVARENLPEINRGSKRVSKFDRCLI